MPSDPGKGFRRHMAECFLNSMENGDQLLPIGAKSLEDVVDRLQCTSALFRPVGLRGKRKPQAHRRQDGPDRLCPQSLLRHLKTGHHTKIASVHQQTSDILCLLGVRHGRITAVEKPDSSHTRCFHRPWSGGTELEGCCPARERRYSYPGRPGRPAFPTRSCPCPFRRTR